MMVIVVVMEFGCTFEISFRVQVHNQIKILLIYASKICESNDMLLYVESVTEICLQLKKTKQMLVE